MEYKTNILTGLRPTGNLTVANYLGAIDPIIKLQNQQDNILIFVADLHALTTNDSYDINKFKYEIVSDYIALGIDPKKIKIFLQSDISGELTTLATFLAKHITVSELLRIPTLKDKITQKNKPESANALLFLYPLLMAADILIQRAHYIPIGEDQLAHIELTKDVARRFNKTYKNIFPIPEPLIKQSVLIDSLRGNGKMSKSSPENAIFLTDSADTIYRKIKRAETATEGTMNKKLESHIFLIHSLCKDKSEKKTIDDLIKEHKRGKQVMNQFKEVFIQVVQRFVAQFQARRAEIVKDPSFITSVLTDGAVVARTNAQETMRLVYQAMS